MNEDQELLRDSTRAFLAKRHPIERLRSVLDTAAKVDRDLWTAGAELGWTAMLVPAEHDGGSVTDQPLVDAVVFGEELGRVLHPGPLVGANVVADAVARWGSDRLRRDVLGRIARGEALAAWCVSADGSLDQSSVGVSVKASGEGFQLDGTAAYVPGAVEADVLLVDAVSDGRLVHAVVPAQADGIVVRPLAALDLTRSLGEVHFSSVELPADAVLNAGSGSGEAAIREQAAAVAAVLQCAEAVGGAEGLFETTVDYLRSRVQFGRPIASFQAIKHRLADLKVLLEAMRAATHYAALAVAEGFDDAPEAVSTAGSFVGDGFAQMCGEALQLHGGIGFTWEHDIHLFLRRAKTTQALHGDPRWHRDRLCSLTEAAAAGRQEA